MEKPDIVYNQCRFCLKVIEELASYSIFSEEPQSNSLYVFVQRMLSLEFTAENSYVCGDCFAVWQMIQDYVQSCVRANHILQISTNLTVRKPWLETEEEGRMLIAVCRRVKKLSHEMEILLRMVQRPPKRIRKRKSTTAFVPDVEPPETGSGNGVKREEEVEIDDSEAFQTDDPIEARRKEKPEVTSPVIEQKDDPPANANESLLDDAVTIIEPRVDQIDLLDSSSEEEDDSDDEEEEEDTEDSLPPGRKKKFDENVLKTVCQLCGATTNDMANHLESHINEPFVRKPAAFKTQTESDSSNSSSSRKRKRKQNQTAAKAPPPQELTLQCEVCGMEFTSMLAAKLHARSHPLYRTTNNSRVYNSGKTKPAVRRAF
ncbi:myelin transcription factor 1-like protein [Aedes aegypti]|uniref:Uncharacterized protein n=1 Tax=Aedes aegypti TaxID=7159 RepID=A0A6I8T4F8_AEDAE|nr:myelin transcription factor 1-like protein [Aedes aegypti]